MSCTCLIVKDTLNYDVEIGSRTNIRIAFWLRRLSGRRVVASSQGTPDKHPDDIQIAIGIIKAMANEEVYISDRRDFVFKF